MAKVLKEDFLALLGAHVMVFLLCQLSGLLSVHRAANAGIFNNFCHLPPRAMRP